MQLLCAFIVAAPLWCMVWEVRQLRLGRTDADAIDRWWASLARAKAAADRRKNPPRLDY